MTEETPDFRLGILCSMPAARASDGRLVVNHSIGRLLDMFRQLVPGAKLCIPILDAAQSSMTYAIDFPPEEVTPLPPLASVARSQIYYFKTRKIVRRFAQQSDVLFIRWPFQIPHALVGLGTPKLVHIVGNAYNVIAASS